VKDRAAASTGIIPAFTRWNHKSNGTLQEFPRQRTESGKPAETGVWIIDGIKIKNTTMNFVVFFYGII